METAQDLPSGSLVDCPREVWGTHHGPGSFSELVTEGKQKIGARGGVKWGHNSKENLKAGHCRG
jgi:hypothetical protein